jgi:RNA polymerase sigma-70 factor (ECF subfamily)
MTGEELTRLALNGGSLDELCRESFSYIRSAVKRLVPECDIDDVIQEVYIALLKGIESYRGDSAYLTWLYAVTWRRCVDWNRRGIRRRKRELWFANQPNPTVVFQESEQESNINQIKEMLTDMPEGNREIMFDGLILGITPKEIAERRHMTYEAVRSRQRRGIAWIRNHRHAHK